MSLESLTFSGLPLVPEEVTKEWLSKVLHLDLSSAELTAEINGTASKLLFTLTYNKSQPLSESPTFICVKGGMNPRLSKPIRQLLSSIFRREVMFYQHIAPKLTSMRLAHCWWASESSEQGIIIMEDLVKRALKFGTVTKPWDLDLVRSGLVQLAILHSTTWGQCQKDYAWLTPHYDESVLGMIANNNYNQFIHDQGRPQLPENLQDQHHMEALFKKYFSARNPKFQTMLHGDCHVKNTTISPNDEVGFIDWQLLSSGSCFHDVVYFINSAMTIEDRRKHEIQLLDYYLEELYKQGGPCFSSKQDDVMLEFKKSQLAGFGMILATTEMQPIEDLKVLIMRFVAGIEDHETVNLIKGIELD